jgi:uncharacterized membrane protein
MSALPVAAAPRPQTSRVVFLDLARAAAVLFMIQGHAIHQLLDPVYEPGLGFQAWLFLRGLTSCMFLLLSGFSFSLASDRYWDELRRPSARLLKRINRFLFLLGLGYLIRFPMGRFAHLQFANDERWRSFLQVDILQLVAGTLFLMQVLMMLLARRRRFALACAGIAALILAATPLVWTRPLAGTIPLWLASYLSSETGSNFPLFPWAAFMFFGAALGMAWSRRGAPRPLSQTAAAFAVLGAALLVAGLVMFLLPVRPFGEIDVWRAGPSTLTIRLGSVLILLGGFAFVSRSIPRLPGAVQALSRESLTIYVVHVAILYGSLWTPGLARYLGRQDLAHTVLWIAILTVSMGALAWVWNQTKRHPPTLTYALRFVIASALLWPLL